MAISVRLRDGRIIDFPESYSQEQIKSYLLNNFDASELAAEESGYARGAADMTARMGGTFLDTIGGAADLAKTDAAAPISDANTMVGRIERSMRQVPVLGDALNTGARAVEVGENAFSAIGRGAAGLIREYGPGAAAPIASLIDIGANEVQREQLRRRQEENAARAARGEQSLESETGGTFAQAFADQARSMADAARDAQSEESKIEQMQLSSAFDEGIGKGFAYAATNQFDTFTAIAPEVVAFLLGGGIVGRGAKTLGAADEAAVAISLQSQGAAAAEMNASGAAKTVRELSDERIAELPMGQELMAQGLSVSEAREEMARRAYDATIGISAPLNAALMGATQKLNLNPVETAVVGGNGFGSRVAAMEGLTGRLARGATGFAAEGTSEFVEEGADKLASNLGEISGGAREGKDVLEGTATAGAMGLLAGGAMGGGLGLMTGPQVAKQRTDVPTDLRAPAEQGEADVAAIWRAALRGEEIQPPAQPGAPAAPEVQPLTPPDAAQAAPAAPTAAPATLPATPVAAQPQTPSTHALMVQPADELEAQLQAAGAAPRIQLAPSPSVESGESPQQVQTVTGAAAPAGKQSRPKIEYGAWKKPEFQDTPNFGMPEVVPVVPDTELAADGKPLVAPRDKDMSPERVAIREALINQRLAGKPSVPGTANDGGPRPIAYVMGGGGASGKGTVLKWLIRNGEVDTNNFAMIDPDSFKTGDEDFGYDGIPEYAELSKRGDKRAASIVHAESSNVATEALNRAIGSRMNIVLDKTLGWEPDAILTKLKDAGYEVRLTGVTVDPREAINRSVLRAEGKEGRYVPLNVLLEAHKGFSSHFRRIQQLADSVRLFDNNVGKNEDPILIAERMAGEGELSIHDQTRYNDFEAKAGLNPQAKTYKEIGYGSSLFDASGVQRAAGSAAEGAAGPVRQGDVAGGTRGPGAAAEPSAPPVQAEPAGQVTEAPASGRQSRAPGEEAGAQPQQRPQQQPQQTSVGKAVTAVMRALGLKDDAIVIARNPAEVFGPDGMRALNLDANTEGYYYNGQAYVFTDNIASPARGVWVALHEHSGHHGLATLLGDRFVSVMNYAASNPLVKAIADDLRAEAEAEAEAGVEGANPTDDPNLFIEEALVELQAAVLTNDFSEITARYPSVAGVKTASAPGLIQRVINAIKAALGKAGAPKMTDAEVGQLLRDARRAARTQQRGTGTSAPEAGRQRRAALNERIDYQISPTGAVTVTGDIEATRQILADRGITDRGVLRDGVLSFTENQSPRIIAALSGETNAASRAGAVYEHVEKDGEIVGAPPKYNTREKLAALRAQISRLAREGERGKMWYENSGRGVLAMVGGDKAEARKFMQLLAIYSPQSDIAQNFVFALRAWMQIKAGVPVNVKSKAQDRKAEAVVRDGKPWDGEKTNNFYINLMRAVDPENYGPEKMGVTSDMWMARAFEYPTDAPNDSQYRFIEIETNRLARELGWEPQQTQAAIWVALKTRMNADKQANRRVDEQSVAAGDITFEDGKRKFTSKEGEQNHRTRWITDALSRNVNDKQMEVGEFNFGDAIGRYLGQISWEARPGRSTNDAMDWINDAPYGVQAEYQEAIDAAFRGDDGQDLLASEIGLPTVDYIDAPGVWQGEVSAGGQTIISLPLRKNPADYKRDLAAREAAGEEISFADRNMVDPDAQRMVTAYAAIKGLLLKQEGVGWHRPDYATSKRDANGVSVPVGRPLSPEEMLSFATALETAVGADMAKDMPIISAPDGVRVLNFTSMQNPQFHETIKGIASSSLPDSLEAELQLFRSDGALVENNWKENPNGEDYRGAIVEAGFGPAADWADRVLAPRIERVQRDFSARYGRGRQSRRAANGQPRVRRDGAPGGAGGLVETSSFPADAPSFRQRKQQADAVSAQGIHYSGAAGLTALDGKFAGSGSAGGERRRFGMGQYGANAKPGETGRRLYFYVQEGDTPPRKEDVVTGRERYAVKLTNLYDYEADPRGLREEAGSNMDYLEELVNDAGFDGLLLPPLAGIDGSIAILHGLKKKVPVISAPLKGKQSRPATKAARIRAKELRERKSQLARELTQQNVTVEQIKAWTNKARLLIGEVGASRDFAKEIADAKRELTPERRDALQGDREALSRYDDIRDMIGMLDANQRAVRAKAMEANRLLDKVERRTSLMSLTEREQLLNELGESLDKAEQAYIAAKAIADWRAKNDYNIVKAYRKRDEVLSYLASEGFQQGSMPWGTGTLMEKKDKALRKIRRVFQDRLIDLRDVQEQIESEIGRAIDDMQNVYRAENQMHGKTADAIQGFHEKMRDPLIETINQTGLSLATVERYLWAKHARERNDKIAAIRPGVTDGSGMTNDEADAILGSFTPEQTRKLEAVSRKVQEIRKFTLSTMVQSGQIDQRSADAMLNAYADYVPLRGKNEEYGDERVGQGRGTGQGISAGGTGIVRALGRKTPPKNILAELVGDAERSIVQSQKAEVGRALLRMALSYPNPEIWEIQPVELKPTFNEATGEVYLAVTSTAQQDAESVVVKHNGKPYRVMIKHPQLRDALRNSGVQGAEWFVRYFGMINRWFSAVFTRFNPGFVPINLMRDITLGLTGVASELGAGSAGKISALYFDSFGASFRQARRQSGDATKPDADKTIDDWAREAAEAGMKSGWTALDDMDTLQRDIENSMRGVGVIAKTGVVGIDAASTYAKMAKDKVVAGFEWVEALNDGVENGLRLATYIHLRRDKGWTKAKAAEYAKELTVNFNRKGMAGSIINSMYLFYNAAVQGSRRTIQVMKHPKTMGTLAAIGAAQFTLAAALGSAKFGDDEDDETLWEKIPDHVKRRSFVIPTGFGDDGSAQYIAIPMPFGFNAVPAVAGYAANYTNPRWVAKQGGTMALAGNAIGYTTSTVIDALSPIAVGEEDAFWPTLVQMGMQFAANRDSLGRSIAPSDVFTRYETPRSEMYKPGTFIGYVWAARALNRLGLGDQYTPPRVMAGLLDVSPNDLEFLTGQLLGGPGNIMNQTWRMGALAVAGEEIKASDIPIVRTIVGEQRREVSEVRTFYDNKDRIERDLDRLRDAFVQGGERGFYEKRAELGPMYADVNLKIRKEWSEDGRFGPGEPFFNERTGNPTLVSADGTLLDEYREARKELSDLNAAVRRVFNDRSLTSAQKQAEIMKINRDKGAAVANVNRLSNRLKAMEVGE